MFSYSTICCRRLSKNSRFDRNANGGIILEVNLRKMKWLDFGGYNNIKLNIDIFLSKLAPILDQYPSPQKKYLSSYLGFRQFFLSLI